MQSVVRRTRKAPPVGPPRAVTAALLVGALVTGCDAVTGLFGGDEPSGQDAPDADEDGGTAEGSAPDGGAGEGEAAVDEGGAGEGDGATKGAAADPSRDPKGGAADAGVAARPPPAPDPEPEDAGDCPEGKGDPEIGVLVSPRRAVAGDPARILVATLATEDKLASARPTCCSGAPDGVSPSRSSSSTRIRPSAGAVPRARR